MPCFLTNETGLILAFTFCPLAIRGHVPGLAAVDAAQLSASSRRRLRRPIPIEASTWLTATSRLLLEAATHASSRRLKSLRLHKGEDLDLLLGLNAD